MRVLLLVHYYFPHTQSCVQMMRDLALELRDRGHEVVLAAPDETLTQPMVITDEDGVTVIRIRSGRFRGVSRPVRAWNEWRLSATMWRTAEQYFRDHPCRLIVNYSPTILFAPLVRRLKRLWGSRNYLVLRDIFPKWNVDAGVIREGGLVHRFFRHYELMLYETADTIGVQSKRNLDYFEEEGLSSRLRLEVLYNWARAEGVEVAETRYREELGLEDRVVFLYGGNFGVAQDVLCIVRLADMMRREEPRAFFLLVGDGSEAEELKAAAAERGLDNLRFLPPVDQATYLGMVAEFDVGLITLNRALKSHNFPGKLREFMILEKPVLAAVNPGNDLRELLREQDAGRICWNGDDQELRDLALDLTRDADLRRRLGRNGRRLLEELFSPARAALQILAQPAGSDRD